LGEPVYNYGPNKGKPKKVGVTASGVVASAGTVAADPKVFPIGTKLLIPGRGVCRVEDVGGGIKGRHIDVWFPTHKEALKWGVRWLKVEKVKDIAQ
jgi:3D (Asp-Asp-Asp) domain-containing protein